MELIETFAWRPGGSLSRRRLIQTIAAVVASAPLAAVTQSSLTPMPATAATNQSPPSYDSIIGLL